MKAFPFGSALVILCLACVCEIRSQPAPLHPLSIEAAAKSVTVGVSYGRAEDTSASYDGTWVAYAIYSPAKPVRGASLGLFASTGYPQIGLGSSTLRVVDLASGRTFMIGGKSESTWGASWSPDSNSLAFYSDRSGQVALWIWNRKTKTSRELCKEVVHPLWPWEVPVWSPDSKTILFKVLPKGMTLKRVLALSPGYQLTSQTHAKAGVTVQYFHPNAQPVQQSNASPNALDASSACSHTIGYLSDLVQVDVATGHVARVASSLCPNWYAYSPNGEYIAYLNYLGEFSNSQSAVSELQVVRRGSTQSVTLVQRLVTSYGTGQSWSPDSTRIAYVTGGQKSDASMYVVSVAGGAPVRLSRPLGFPNRDGLQRAPLWDPSGRSLYSIDDVHGTIVQIAADGSRVRHFGIAGTTAGTILSAADRRRFWSIDGGRTLIVQLQGGLDGRQFLCRFDVQRHSCIATLAKNAKLLLGSAPGFGRGTLFPYVVSDAFDPGNVWVTDARFAAARQISNENAELRNASLGQIRIITWHSRTGELLHGALLLPGNYRVGIRYPMMVLIYAGDMGSTHANTFGLWDTAYLDMQFLASRGYAVLYPDIPIHPALHSPMHDVYDAVMPGVDRAIALGIADPQKLAVMGQSFGGYNTIGILTQTTRFKAAIATSPAPTELFEGYVAPDGMGMGYYELGQGDMGCTPWACRARYIANSPMLFLDRVTTPLLLEGGLDDHISFENEQIFSGLQRLGKEVELLEYADEQHELTNPENIVDFWTRALKFLDTHLESFPPSS